MAATAAAPRGARRGFGADFESDGAGFFGGGFHGGGFHAMPDVASFFGLGGVGGGGSGGFGGFSGSGGGFGGFRDVGGAEFEVPQEAPRDRPAARDAVAALRTETLAEGEGAACEPCPVCMCEFEKDDACTTMPCGHTYHAECLGPWLAKQNTCPTCRFPLPTDDAAANEAVARERAQRAEAAVRRAEEEDKRSAAEGGGEVGSAASADAGGAARWMPGVRDLKQALRARGVDFRGCVEKGELVALLREACRSRAG